MLRKCVYLMHLCYKNSPNAVFSCRQWDVHNYDLLKTQSRIFDAFSSVLTRLKRTNQLQLGADLWATCLPSALDTLILGLLKKIGFIFNLEHSHFINSMLADGKGMRILLAAHVSPGHLVPAKVFFKSKLG